MHARDCLTSGAAGPAWGGPREHRENALLDGNGALHQRRVAREAAEELERSAALQLRHRERDLGGPAAAYQVDRKSAMEGKRGPVRVVAGWCRFNKIQKREAYFTHNQ